MADTTIDDKTMAVIRKRARALAAQAPTLTSEQIVQLRHIFANPTGGGVS